MNWLGKEMGRGEVWRKSGIGRGHRGKQKSVVSRGGGISGMFQRPGTEGDLMESIGVTLADTNSSEGV